MPLTYAFVGLGLQAEIGSLETELMLARSGLGHLTEEPAGYWGQSRLS